MQLLKKLLYITISVVITFSLCCCRTEQKEENKSSSGTTTVMEKENQEETEQEIEEIVKIVFITPTGKRYHYKYTCAGKNAKAVMLSEAEKNYTRCKKCT